MRGTCLTQICVLVGVLLPISGFGQPVQNGLPRLLRAGGGFACETSKEQYEWDKKNNVSADAACGQVGPLSLGMKRADAEKILGSPTTGQSFGNRIFYVYSLQTDETAHMTTYVVIGYDSEQRIGSIQLTGTPWPGAWSFADIRLGDPDKAIISRLGNPNGISPSRKEGTIVWDYLPWTFSFEIRNSVVSSIRVSE